MSVVVQMPAAGETKGRRLHLRDVTGSGAPEADGQTVGHVLRARREALALDERAVAARLCLRRDLVASIEAGQYSRLHGRAYALGYIRSYALLLGLDAQQIVNQFKAEVDAVDPARDALPVFPNVQPTGWFGPYRLLAAAGLGAGLLYLLAQVLSVPEPAPTVLVEADESGVTVVDPTPAVDAGARSAIEANPRVESGPVPVVPAAVATPAAGLPSRIILTATEAAYLEIRDPSAAPAATKIVARELSAGESFSIPNREGLVLLTGNAGGLLVAVDGRAVGPLGARGQVIRGLNLDPAYFLSRPETSR
jgi:cytoskeletal protein RodZ